MRLLLINPRARVADIWPLLAGVHPVRSISLKLLAHLLCQKPLENIHGKIQV